MKIAAINNQNFQAKKFRVSAVVTMPDTCNPLKTITRKMIQEYSNPCAKNYYKQAQKEKSLQRRIELYEAMGEYKLIDPREEGLLAEIKRKLVDTLF